MADNIDFSSDILVDEISHLSDQEQAEKLADHFSSIIQEYDALTSSDVALPQIEECRNNYFSPSYVLPYIERIKTNKSNILGDIPSKVIKRFAKYFCLPFTDILNSMIRRGEYPYIWK